MEHQPDSDRRPQRSRPDASNDEGLQDQKDSPSLLDVLSRSNMQRALKRVLANKGTAGVDGMEVTELPPYLKARWTAIRTQLINGTYQPQPVRVVYIPKPKGGQRMLGIPCVLDRLIQQAISQCLVSNFDKTFSPHSFGFRP